VVTPTALAVGNVWKLLALRERDLKKVLAWALCVRGA